MSSGITVDSAMNHLYLALVIIVVLGLAATPITYYLRSRRNPDKAPPTATPKTFKDWKD
ncbi:MAG: hypothetical protein Q7J29_07735 [Stagnimonas sp.]|nr:hypothetical protein [Stagnimonas sp.]